MSTIKLTLPDFLGSKEILWNNTDYTYIVGENGSGKTILLNIMAEYFQQNNKTFVTYDAIAALNNYESFIESLSDDTIKLVVKHLSDFSLDFSQDLLAWSKHLNGNTFDEIGPILDNVETLRTVLKLSGNGYSRMTVMLATAIDNMTADYYLLDMPETSLHVVIARNWLNIIMKVMPYTKIVMTTHSPIMIDTNWDLQKIIEL